MFFTLSPLATHNTSNMSSTKMCSKTATVKMKKWKEFPSSIYTACNVLIRAGNETKPSCRIEIETKNPSIQHKFSQIPFFLISQMNGCCCILFVALPCWDGMWGVESFHFNDKLFLRHPFLSFPPNRKSHLSRRENRNFITQIIHSFSSDGWWNRENPDEIMSSNYFEFRGIHVDWERKNIQISLTSFYIFLYNVKTSK